MRIRAALFHGPGRPFTLETLDLAEPRAGEVLVRMKATGICHSDWHLMTGATKHPVPCVPGHEGAGVVEALGQRDDGGDGSDGGESGNGRRTTPLPAPFGALSSPLEGRRVGPDNPRSPPSSVKIGDHVALNWAPSCGECFYCNVGRPSLCGAYVEPIWAGTMMDGTTRLSLRGEPVYHFSALACFAEYAVVPTQCCVPLPKEVPFEVAAVIGCAVATGVGAVLNTAKIADLGYGASVAVYGVGGVGLSAVMGAKLAGASQIIAVDSVPSKLETAREFGATDVVLARVPEPSPPFEDSQAFPLSAQSSDRGRVAEQIRALIQGRGADYVIECVGIPALQEECLDAVRPGGVVVLAGIAPMGSGTNFPGAVLTRQEKTVMGCYYGTVDPARDFPLYAEWYREGRLPLDRLITHRYSLDQINEAYADLIAGRNARGVVVFGD